MPSLKSPSVIALTIGAALSVATTTARADCDAPVGFALTAQGSSVSICPGYNTMYGVPMRCSIAKHLSPIVRQNVATGEVVTVADYCASDGACWIDECVPPGEYRYGFEQPLRCCQSCLWTAYYGTVTVAAGEDAGACARAGSDPGPTDAGTVPWTDAQAICFGSCGGPGTAQDAAPAADDADANVPSTEPTHSNSGSCAVNTLGRCPGEDGAATFVGAAVIAAGLTRRRRR